MEQRLFIKLAFEDGVQGDITYGNLVERYGREALCYSAFTYWHWEFRRGRQDIEDDPRSGRIPDFEIQIRIRGALEQEPFTSVEVIAEATGHAPSTVFYAFV
jgi:hypothetical protein